MVNMKTGLIGALDVGTNKVACLIAVPDEDHYRVIGMGHQQARGMRGGVVADMDLAEQSIRNAIDQAERMAGETLRNVFVSFSGGNIRSRIMRVEIPINDQFISDMDIHRLHLQCRGGVENSVWQILHTIPVSYMVDGVPNVDDPRRMVASTLAADMHVIAVPTGPLRNLALCVERCILSISGITVSAYASALAILYQDQMRLGATLLDLGGGATSVSVFRDNRLYFVDSVPVGSNHITNDIARGLNTSTINAERLKTRYGSAIASPMDEREFINVPRLIDDERGSGNQIAKSALVGIITPRVEEIFELVRERIGSLNGKIMSGQKIILTGGGSQLEGIDELAQRVLDKPVIIGQHHGVRGLGPNAVGPAFTATAGLLRYADIAHLVASLTRATDCDNTKNTFGRLGRWFKHNLWEGRA